MFGISPLGWVHTLGSLPAIPVGFYMFAHYGRIVPRSKAGAVYFGSMLIGAGTVFVIAHQPVSYVIGAATLALVLIGYGAAKVAALGRWRIYIETLALSLSAFLLMIPTVTETLRRVPDGHPIVTDMKSPILLGAYAVLLMTLVVGVAFQVYRLRQQQKAA
ncbi:MAG: hypothetical protein PW788_14910 [Micavibrio sp.]|nr:hypothetical protein [Micavibrio sp.]